jgi:hypothetical protein
MQPHPSNTIPPASVQQSGLLDMKAMGQKPRSTRDFKISGGRIAGQNACGRILKLYR